jgi:glycogen debranching enzyme
VPGSQEQRDNAYHQGTVWPWLLQPYCEAYISLYKESGVSLLAKIIQDFEPVINELGIGTIPEIFDGTRRTSQEGLFPKPGAWPRF